MAGLVIDEDWDVGVDGYCTMTLTVPNNSIWRANIKGAIYALTEPTTYEPVTGDVDQAAQHGADIYNSIGVVCP